jgi:death on curing protein
MAKPRETQRLSVDEVRDFAHRVALEMSLQEIAEEPIPEFETRYSGRLESCLHTPFQAYAGHEFYDTLPRKGAVLFYLLIKNHPFANGNKRIAVVTLLLFLLKNDFGLQMDYDAMYSMAREVAESDAQGIESVVTDLAAKIEVAMLPASDWIEE